MELIIFFKVETFNIIVVHQQQTTFNSFKKQNIVLNSPNMLTMGVLVADVAARRLKKAMKLEFSKATKLVARELRSR